MPIFQLDELQNELSDIGIYCRIGRLESDVPAPKRPYFEKWLSDVHGGFVKVLNSNIDYIGIEDIMRLGPFFNVYCLVENDSIVENDNNAHKLVDANPYYELRNGKLARMGWSGGVLADILEKDTVLHIAFEENIMEEEIRKISVKPANFACIIETRTWDPVGLASSFKIMDRIASNVRQLLKQIHLGENLCI